MSWNDRRYGCAGDRKEGRFKKLRPLSTRNYAINSQLRYHDIVSLTLLLSATFAATSLQIRWIGTSLPGPNPSLGRFERPGIQSWMLQMSYSTLVQNLCPNPSSGQTMPTLSLKLFHQRCTARVTT